MCFAIAGLRTFRRKLSSVCPTKGRSDCHRLRIAAWTMPPNAKAGSEGAIDEAVFGVVLRRAGVTFSEPGLERAVFRFFCMRLDKDRSRVPLNARANTDIRNIGLPRGSML